MKMDRTFIVFSTVSAAVVVGLSLLFYLAYMESTGGMKYDKTAVSKEMARLASLSSEEKIATDDLAGLAAMLKGNTVAKHELEEIGKLIQYGEYWHATHTLAFLDSYIETGRETICPGHELAHYYVWNKHGKGDLAEEALEEAREQMSEWQEKARPYYEKYPGEVTFDEIVGRINSHLNSIESGSTVTTDEEITFLAEKSVCVN
jgi:hypothetical protein